jgi:alkane 1-monooxygenase
VTSREAAAASGFLTFLVPPTLLASGTLAGQAWLAFAAVFIVAPLLRAVIGEVSDKPRQWSEVTATVLEMLPVVYVLVLISTLAVTLVCIRRANLAAGALVSVGASMFAVFVLASCVAHELLHRKSVLMRALGGVLSGVIGYPLLETDHRNHHRLANRMRLAEAPYPTETVWQFSFRRGSAVIRRATEEHRAGIRSHRLWLAIAAMVGTAALFAVVAGVRAFVLYLIVAALSAWSLQAITYLQHWGLGTTDSSGSDLGWEDRCRLQQWLTLGISFHQAHHSAQRIPYYRLMVQRGSPRMPASYAVLFVACLFPPLHRTIMKPALARWTQQPQEAMPARRRVFCGRLALRRRRPGAPP